MVTLFADNGKSLTPKATQTEGEIVNPPYQLSGNLDRFLKDFERNSLAGFHGAESTIRVSDVLGSIAHLYEKIRNIVEYKGEHVLRRNAIERILKRLLWERPSHETQLIAKILLRELIWARYLANDRVPKNKITQVAAIIDKYLYILGKYSSKSSMSVGNLKQWIWGVASSEIEEALDPSNREPYVNLMYQWFTTYFNWTDIDLSEHEKSIQIYLAIHRSLAKSDEEIMRYHLLVLAFPTWQNADKALIDQVIDNFHKIYTEIEKHLNFENKARLYRIIQKHTAPFEVLKDLVKNDQTHLRSIINNQNTFETKIREICAYKYSQIQKKVNTGILRSIIYIFITKVVLALLIEIPYELWRYGVLGYVPLGINVVVPPTMMFLVGLTIRAPGEENTQRIIAKLKTVVYENSNIVPTKFSIKPRSSESLLAKIFAFIYAILFLLVFGGITYLLLLLHFNFIGIIIFFAFLSLVLLFGFRVRFTAQELKVTGDKEGFFGYLFNNLTLPFLSAGVYLSKGLAKLNFLTIFLDFLIEAPLKTIIEVLEEWTSFIREKREEVVEVPQDK